MKGNPLNGDVFDTGRIYELFLSVVENDDKNALRTDE